MPEFFETRMGHTFYDGTMPRIARALETIAERLTEKPAAANAMTPDQEATLRSALRAFRVAPRSPGLAVAPLGSIADIVDLLRDIETFCSILSPLTSVEMAAQESITARITMVLERLERLA